MTVGPGAMCQATSPLQGYRTLQTGSLVRPDGLNTIMMQDIHGYTIRIDRVMDPEVN